MRITQKIAPCLWLDGQAEDAAVFYTAIFEKCPMNAMLRMKEFDITALKTRLRRLIMVNQP